MKGRGGVVTLVGAKREYLPKFRAVIAKNKGIAADLPNLKKALTSVYTWSDLSDLVFTMDEHFGTNFEGSFYSKYGSKL